MKRDMEIDRLRSNTILDGSSFLNRNENENENENKNKNKNEIIWNEIELKCYM